MLIVNNKSYCKYCLEEIPPGADRHAHPPAPESPLALPAGSVLLGKYVVARMLGRGGFGITYLAWDNPSGRRVAIKEYFPASLIHRNTALSSSVRMTTGDPDAFNAGMEKFYEEASLIARFVAEPGIIKVYEFFYENGTAYYVMEYLDGRDLKEYIADHGGRLSERETLAIGFKVAQSLAPIHSVGVLHRDISPDNIFICSDGTVKLIDFGASRQVLGEHSNSLSVILKQSYAPLEQYQRKGRQGPWTDIYALGATLYNCVTGLVPEDATSRLTEPELGYPPDARVSEAFKSLIRKMMSMELSMRQQEAVELQYDMCVAAQSLLPSPDSSGVNAAGGDSPESQCAPAKTRGKKRKRASFIGIGGYFLRVIAAAMTVLCLSALAYSPVQLSVYNGAAAFDCYTVGFSDWLSSELSVAVPDEYDGYPVTSISPWAFCDNARLTEVTVPATVLDLGEEAFMGCISLRRVNLSEGLTRIGDYTFFRCVSLYEITIPATVKSIGLNAFGSCDIVISAPHEPEYYGYVPSADNEWHVTSGEA